MATLMSRYSKLANASVPANNWWIMPRYEPSQAIPVVVLSDPFKRGKTRPQGYFIPLGSTYPFVVDGVVSADVFQLEFLCQTNAEMRALEAFYDAGGVYVMKSPVDGSVWSFRFMGDAGMGGGQPGASSAWTAELVQPVPGADGPWKVTVTILEVGLGG